MGGIAQNFGRVERRQIGPVPIMLALEGSPSGVNDKYGEPKKCEQRLHPPQIAPRSTAELATSQRNINRRHSRFSLGRNDSQRAKTGYRHTRIFSRISFTVLIYRVVYPPSGTMTCPSMNPAPGLHNQSTAEAISSDLPSRPKGISFMTAFIVSWWSASAFATMGVSMAPRQMALMRIPRSAYSRAALFVSPITPCLEAVYAPRPGTPTKPLVDEQLTITPLPRSRIWRSSCFMQFQTPRRLIAIKRSKSSPRASPVSATGT